MSVVCVCVCVFGVNDEIKIVNKKLTKKSCELRESLVFVVE